MLLGIVGNPPGESESQAWDTVLAFADEVSRQSGGSWRNRALAIRDLASRMRLQALRSVHVNPKRVRRAMKMSDHVQAIVYVHEADGEFYVHGFGDAHLDLQVERGVLCIEGLKDRTHVQMFAEPDGSVSIVGVDGQRLWEDFR